MKKTRFASRLALIMAAIICLSTLASCDFGLGGIQEPPLDNDDEKITNLFTERQTERATEEQDRYTDGLEFSRNRQTNEYSVVGYNGSNTVVEVPATYKGNPVTSVDKNAFFRTEVEVIKLPDSIKEIGENAFKNSPNLREIYLGSSDSELEKIGKDAFFSCNSLETIYFFGDDDDWAGVSLGKNWDKNAGSATDSGKYLLYVVDSDTVYTDEETESYTESYTETETDTDWTETESESYIETESLSETDTYWTDTESETPSESISEPEEETTEFGLNFEVDDDGIKYVLDSSYEFYYVTGCTGDWLEELVIPKTFNGIEVRVIYDNAFAGNKNLTSVSIPGSIKLIGKGAFSGCTNLATVYYNLDSGAWSSISIAGNNLPLTSATRVYNHGRVSEGLSYEMDQSGNYAVSGMGSCTDTDIFIPSTYEGIPVTTIRSYAFNGYTIDTINIPDSIYEIGEGALPAVKKITVDENNYTYKSVNNDLYSKDGTVLFRYAALKSNSVFIVPNGVVTIKPLAFEGCQTVSRIIVSNSVESIDRAFQSCSKLTEVTLGSSVGDLNSLLFNHCSALKTVTIGDGTEYVYSQVFNNCPALTTVSLGKNVRSFDSNAFLGCGSVSEIKVDEENEFFCFESGVLYSKDYTTLYFVCPSVSEIEINGAVLYIAENAFAGSSVKEVYLPDNVESIGWRAFSNSKLEVIKLNDGLKTIEYGAFDGTGLTEITIPESVSYINGNVFMNCGLLENIYVSENNSNYNDIDGVLYFAGGELIAYPSGREDVNYRIPYGTTSVNSSAIYNCDHLETLIVPETVSVMYSSAVYDCGALDLVLYGGYSYSLEHYLPASCTIVYNCGTISNGLNYGYSGSGYAVTGTSNANMETVVIPTTHGSYDVVGISDHAFSGNTSIKYVYIPETVSDIGSTAFLACQSLLYIDVSEDNEYYKSVNGVLYTKSGNILVCYPAGRNNVSYIVPDGVTNIGDSAFYNCENLKKVILGNDVVTVGDSAFSGCTQMNYVYIPEGVETLNSGAFYACWNLDNVVLPNSLVTIGDRVFSNCSSLTNITVGTSVEIIGDHFIEYCYGSDPLTVNYRGSASAWANIVVSSDNSFLHTATKNYNYTDGDSFFAYDGAGAYGTGITVSNGSETSDVSVKVTEDKTTVIIPNNDKSLHMSSNGNVVKSGVWMLDGEADYTVESHSTLLLITKNFCTCGDLSECFAFEEIDLYALTGDKTTPDNGCKIRYIDICWEPYYVNGEAYLYFYCDLSEYGYEGRINGFSFDVLDLKEGNREIDLVKVGLFGDEESAMTYAEEYINGLENQ